MRGVGTRGETWNDEEENKMYPWQPHSKIERERERM